jgi:geranylgeranyl pyrophosphate synthase
MDIFKMTIDYLSGLPQVWGWSDLRKILSRAVSKQPGSWRLPVITCAAVGGTLEQAIPASAAVACLQIGIMLIDDMLDVDPRGEYHQRGMPVTANLATAFQAAGLEAITQCDIGVNSRFAALECLNHMMLVTAVGQQLDTENPMDENSYWRLVRLKSSPFFGAAMFTGALFGGATAETAARFQKLGYLYGEMVQIHDDLNDCMAAPANPDWLLGRSSLPVLFAQTVEHPERKRFLDLRQSISDPEALAEAQSILVRCGAVSFVMDQLLRRYQEASEVLESMILIRRDGLDDLLEEVIKPVSRLFSEIGIQFSDLLPFHITPINPRMKDREV